MLRLRSLARGAALLTAAVAVAACGSSADSGTRPTLVVAAAADLRTVFEASKQTLEEASGANITFVFGSSGQLQRQVEAGAQYDVFLSADMAYVESLAAEGAVHPDSVAVYAVGRLALAWRRDLPPLEGVEDLLRGDVNRVALANPDHAPYGRAGREVLIATGLWDQIRPKLILGENVRQATDYVETGNVDAALVTYALVIDTRTPFLLVEPSLHAPIRQGAAIVTRGKSQEAARRFLDFILGAEGQRLLRAAGFEEAR
ncbi:MAG: molybdate ABC transporter substrate-binding protein [Dehalococcoidia bacterium]